MSSLLNEAVSAILRAYSSQDILFEDYIREIFKNQEFLKIHINTFMLSFKELWESYEDVIIGININDTLKDFTGLILSGDKTIETRDSKNNGIQDLLNKGVRRVGLISVNQKRKPSALVVGYATIGDPIHYRTEEEFRQDEKFHKVFKGDPYDFKKEKFGYPLTDIVKVKNPFPPAQTKGIIRTRRLFNTNY